MPVSSFAGKLPPVNLRTLFLRAMLALMLLFTQQLGLAHSVLHLSVQGKVHQLPIEKACEQCAAFAALDSGLLMASPAQPASVAPALPRPQAFCGIVFPRALRGFHSRGPPHPLI